MADKKWYKVSEEYLKELLRDSELLNALLYYGVDNWEGYDMARERMSDDTTIVEGKEVVLCLENGV